MTDAQLNFVTPILDTFQNQDIKEFAIELLNALPDYIWHVGASSTGKYHPQYSLGDGGLMRHQVAVVKFLNFFFELEQYNSKLTSREMDLMRIAGLVHDGRKSGSQDDYEKNEYTKFDHPLQMAEIIRGYRGQYLNDNELEIIASTIEKHMGQWCVDKRSGVTLPKPDNKYSYLLHLADYLASRKCLTMEFENPNVNAETEIDVEFDPETVFTFGKYKGEKMLDVYEQHPDYIEWCLENIARVTTQNAIKAMKKYVEQDADMGF